jgi:hypothetical protein
MFSNLQFLDLWHPEDCGFLTQAQMQLSETIGLFSRQIYRFPSLRRLKINSMILFPDNSMVAPKLQRLDFTHISPGVLSFLRNNPGIQTVQIISFRQHERGSMDFVEQPIDNLANLREIQFDSFCPTLLLFFCLLFPGIREVHAELCSVPVHHVDFTIRGIPWILPPQPFRSMKIRLVYYGASSNPQEKYCEAHDVWSLFKHLFTDLGRGFRIYSLVF